MVFNFLLFHFIFLTHVQCPFICIHFEGHVGIVLLVWRGLEGDLFGTIFQIRPIKPSSLVTWHSRCGTIKTPPCAKPRVGQNHLTTCSVEISLWNVEQWLLDCLIDWLIYRLIAWLIDWFIDWIWLYAVSAIFQPYYGGETMY